MYTLASDPSSTHGLADVVATGPLLFGLFAAALAGLVSFASPCVVPLVPGYISYLASVVGGEVSLDSDGPAVARGSRARVTGAAALFVAGFTVVFVLATASVFGAVHALTLGATTLQRIGGVVTIIMGIAFLGYIPALQHDTRLQPKKVSTWVGAPVLGAVFALGWTPCLGPTLASIISIAVGTEGTTAARGVALIVAYCLGLGVPFLLVALGSARAMRSVGWMRRHSRVIQRVGGVLLILVGLSLVTGMWDSFIGIMRQWTVSYGSTLL